MLNLSDKELDRLSKEAAQEYDPGDILGANSWEKLQVSLDTELGPSGPNPLRHIRRFPFYYAPALLLVVVGLSYYLSRHAGVGARGTASGGPPGRTAQATAETRPGAGTKQNDLSQNTVNTDKSTSTLSTSTTTAAPSEKGNGGAAGANHGQAGNNQVESVAERASSPQNLANRRSGKGSKTDEGLVSGNARTAGRGQGARTSQGQGGGTRQGGTESDGPGTTSRSGQGATNVNGQGGTPVAAGAPGSKQQQELTYSRTPGLQSTRKTPVIGDSALRAFTLKSSPPQLKMRALYIQRTLQFGLLAAPDYSSVNSLAGDKPGSTFGLTIDYEFVNKWYLSSGLLLSRKNYSATSSDFNAPAHWYTDNGISRNSLALVKGSFEMVEIPLNLRYDFSVAGSTLFFASAGLSSYLLTSESCNYYLNYGYGNIWKNPAHQSYLFSAANLSLGVETGISNSLTILIAPYAKLPVRNVGIGQVQMNSVGIDFVLKYSPITSRKRR
jgi:hypothetical protein